MKKRGVILKKEKEKIFHQQHLWIFSGAIASFPENFQQGHIYPIYSHDLNLLGHGYFHRGHSLSGRILAVGAEDPWKKICAHIDRAIAFREALFDLKDTNAFRLLNGEGDLIPGLIIDQYDRALVLQSGTLGIDLLKDKIVEYLISKNRWIGIYEKSVGASRKEEALPEYIRALYGEKRETFQIVENNLRFEVYWEKGQKTGFFLDQREMRKQVQQLSRNLRVFNCFCYSGGFSIYALAGGARYVESLDSSEQVMQWAKNNIGMNGFSAAEHSCVTQDAFEFLSNNALDYDLVILDPPAFAKKKQDIPQASKGYREINYQAMSKMPKNSFLLTCSCSYYIDEQMFQTLVFQAAKSARKNVQIVGRHRLAMDHPINVFHPESSYLKSFLLYLS